MSCDLNFKSGIFLGTYILRRFLEYNVLPARRSEASNSFSSTFRTSYNSKARVQIHIFERNEHETDESCTISQFIFSTMQMIQSTKSIQDRIKMILIVISKSQYRFRKQALLFAILLL